MGEVSRKYVFNWLTAQLTNLLIDTCQESFHLDGQWEIRLGVELLIYRLITNYP